MLLQLDEDFRKSFDQTFYNSFPRAFSAKLVSIRWKDFEATMTELGFGRCCFDDNLSSEKHQFSRLLRCVLGTRWKEIFSDLDRRIDQKRMILVLVTTS